MNSLPRRPIDILLVEDNPGDVGLVREGLDAGTLAHVLHVAPSARQAMAFLRPDPTSNGDHPRPDLVILDLNLPGVDGHQLLREIKADRALRTIPVCVLTSSSDPADIDRCYDAHANAFVTKPMELDEFIDAVQDIESFWLSTASLPTGGPP